MEELRERNMESRAQAMKKHEEDKQEEMLREKENYDSYYAKDSRWKSNA